MVYCRYDAEYKVAFPQSNSQHDIKWKFTRNSNLHPIQKDGHSCGIFMSLGIVHYLLNGTLPTSKDFNFQHAAMGRLYIRYQLFVASKTEHISQRTQIRQQSLQNVKNTEITTICSSDHE